MLIELPMQCSPFANLTPELSRAEGVGLNELLGRWPGDLQMTIFGYTWDEIKRAQQGGALARRIPAGICKPLATEGDWELLERYGEAELRNRHYFGVLDRLENTRMANDMPDCGRSACRDHSLSACDNPDCPSLRPNAPSSPAAKQSGATNG